jgi:hypothetical protein
METTKVLSSMPLILYRRSKWNTLIFNITTLENVYKMERLNYITSRELTILPTYLPKTLDPLSSPNSEANSTWEYGALTSCSMNLSVLHDFIAYHNCWKVLHLARGCVEWNTCRYSSIVTWCLPHGLNKIQSHGMLLLCAQTISKRYIS